jgi:hypothetical protein
MLAGAEQATGLQANPAPAAKTPAALQTANTVPEAVSSVALATPSSGDRIVLHLLFLDSIYSPVLGLSLSVLQGLDKLACRTGFLLPTGCFLIPVIPRPNYHYHGCFILSSHLSRRNISTHKKHSGRISAGGQAWV